MPPSPIKIETNIKLDDLLKPKTMTFMQAIMQKNQEKSLKKKN
jgi:hypothetical protein